MERKIDLATIDAIIFDLGGVLLNIDYQKTIAAFVAMGIANFGELYSQSKQAGLFDQFEKGLITEHVFIDSILALAPTLTPTQVIQAWNAMLLDMPLQRLAFLAKLRRTKQLFCYSNINAIHEKKVSAILQATIQQADLNAYFDKVYYSHHIHHRKPDQAGFVLIMEEQHLQPARTLFVDDSIQHIQAAQALGLQTFFLAPGLEIDQDIF
jgi:FMN phosphatase YigB (HAD superfamily)